MVRKKALNVPGSEDLENPWQMKIVDPSQTFFA